MAEITVSVTWYYDRDEPDGSECHVCCDQCFLSMWRLVWVINGKRQNCSGIVLCESCHQALMEGL